MGTNTLLVKMVSEYKIEFQYDAYRPLVDRIPACTARGCLPGGVSAQGGMADPPHEQNDRQL